MTLSRRALLLSSLAVSAAPAARAQAPAVRVGTLRYGSVAWELDVMRTHGLDSAAGFTLAPAEFAAAQAAQVALQAGAVDVILQDWLWVSRQRASGADWTFVPTSSAVGAVMTPGDSPIRSIADLPGKRLGIAGSPIDKSWLLLRAFASKQFGLDLDHQVEKSFATPPLLAEQLRAGQLDAALTYWPYAARAEAAGMRPVLTVADAVTGLGIAPGLPFTGWVFSQAWAQRLGPAAEGFFHASQQARTILLQSDAEWTRIAPLTGAASPAELDRLKAWYREGVPGVWDFDGQTAAARLYDILAGIGGAALVGDATHLSPGTFWEAGQSRPG